jgi:apolipoprotein N-acyltransferase
VSAVIDPVGRVVAQLGLGVEGVLDSGLPAPVAPTIYARLGELPAAVLVALAMMLVLLRRRPPGP